jgi:ribosome-binding factor A
MQQERVKKIEWVVSELVSRFIFEEIEGLDEEFWVITIITVKLASDLSYLDIFVSCFKNEELLPKALAKHAYTIQKKLNAHLPLRKTPRIRFRYDWGWAIAWELNSKIIDLTKNLENDYDK